MASFSYHVPTKRIHTDADFESYQKSDSFKDILDFVKGCADAVVNVTNVQTGEQSVHRAIRGFAALMDKGYALVDEAPPIHQPMRFGNKAFRTWLTLMEQHAQSYLAEILPEEKSGALVELLPYICEMFGNSTRIDYGTGHELNFAVFFLIMHKMEIIGGADLKDVVSFAFVRYIRTMRRLQVDYMLEPAGSHGVWGLDDYHCLVFLWGSAQLANNPHCITPSSIHDEQIMREYTSDYLYLEGVAFIRAIKKGAPFAETSPMLNDISHIGEWSKICAGLMRLFQGEVINKFQVIQHLLFGSVLRASW